MEVRLPFRAKFALGLLLFVATPALQAQAPQPKIYMTGDIQANTETLREQSRPSTAAADDGRYLVVWNGDAAQAGYYDILVQLFDRNGSKIGGEVQVDQAPNDHIAFTPRVAFGNGRYLVIWADYNNTVTEANVWGRALDVDAIPLGDAFQINTYTTGRQRLPDVAGTRNGEWVAVWEGEGQDGDGWGIFGQRYDANFQPVGPEFVVNSFVQGDQYRPSVAYSDEGTFVVSYDSYYDVSTGYEVLAQEFDGVGAVGNLIQVSGLAPGDQLRAAVSLIGANAWLFAYTDNVNVFLRQLRDGNLGTQILVNAPTLQARASPSLSSSSAANLIGVSWDCFGKDDPNDPAGSGVFARLFERDSAQRLREKSDEFRVNAYTQGTQGVSKIAIGDHGEIRLVWQSGPSQDGDGNGVFSALGNDPETRPMQVDSQASGGTSNLNGVAEQLERVMLITKNKNRLPLILILNGQLVHDPTSRPESPLASSVIDDATSDFGAIPGDAEVDCFTATSDCYEVTLTGPRPGPHWDEPFRETLSTGFSKSWLVHVGESFADVPTTNLFYAFIENLLHNGVTAGGACGGYCPTDGVKRQQMAVFLLKSRYGPGFTPPPATGAIFTDVTLANPFAAWIEALYLLGITGGCSGGPPPAPTQFCPDAIVNRQQMAVFLLKTLEGSAYTPPAAAGIFQDVPLGNPFVAWIEELYNRQVTGGCVASPLQYCPLNPTNRQQMAAFLVKTFGLLLYGP